MPLRYVRTGPALGTPMGEQREMTTGDLEGTTLLAPPHTQDHDAARRRLRSKAPRKRLDGQVAVVTGGGRGLGLAIADAFAREGARLVLAARTGEQLRRAAETCREHGAEAAWTAADVRRPEDVERLFEFASAEFGPVDIVVNNAAVSGPTAPLVDVTLAEWEETLAADLTSLFLCSRAALRQMIPRRAGNILNIGSIFGKRSYPYRTPYAAAKWALIGVTQSLAHEVGRHGIRVNAICPGPIAGERIERVWRERSERRGIPVEALRDKMLRMSALGRIPTSAEVAELAVFLASDAARGMTGQAINLSAGMEMR